MDALRERKKTIMVDNSRDVIDDALIYEYQPHTLYRTEARTNLIRDLEVRTHLRHEDDILTLRYWPRVLATIISKLSPAPK